MSSAVVAGPPVTTVLVGQPPAPVCAAQELACRGVELLAAVAPRDAVRLVSLHRPQVVVVNLDAGQAALTALASVTATVQQIPVLTLTAVPDPATVLAAVRAGAASHLVAPADADELAAAVRCTAAGQAVFSPGLADVLLEQFGRPVDAQEGARRLTEREADVLRLVVDGLTARQIAARLVLSPRTVENHVQNVLRKLRLRSRAALVRYAIENGLA
jgi:DNA-binding NarL/FixJ family response regulator